MDLKQAKMYFAVYMQRLREGVRLTQPERDRLNIARQKLRQQRKPIMNVKYSSMHIIDISKVIKAIKKRYKETGGNITSDEIALLKELAEEFNTRVERGIKKEGKENLREVPKSKGTCWCGKKAIRIIRSSKGPIAYVCSTCFKNYSDPEFIKGSSNPRGVLIYGKVNRIIATKTQNHICDAECKRHGHRYYHDFTSMAKMYGLPDGSILIKA